MTLVVSLLNGGTNSHPEPAANFGSVATDFVANGIVGAVTNTAGVSPATGGLSVNQEASPNNQVQIAAGTAWVTGTPSGGSSQNFRIVNSAAIDQTLNPNVTGGTRYDWIYLSLDTTKLANPGVNADDVATIVVSRSTSASTDNGGGAPTYGYNLAVVTVANAFTTIANAAISDKRVQAGINSVLDGSIGGTDLSTSAITLGYTANPAAFSTASSSAVQVTGLSSTVTVPTGGRRVKITVFCRDVQNTVANSYSQITIWDGAVGSGTKIAGGYTQSTGASIPDNSLVCMAVQTPTAGTHTYNVGLNIITSGTSTLGYAAIEPSFILVEAI